MWAVTHHAEAKRLLTDPRLVKDINVWGAWQRGEIAPDWPLIGLANPPRSMLTVDGADHRRLRTLVAQALTPRRVERMRDRITELTESLLDQVAAQPGDRVDLKAVFAYPLPMFVIADLMGLAEERLPRLKELFEKFFSTQTPPEEVVATLTELAGIMAETVAAKKGEPGRRPDVGADPGVGGRRPADRRGDRRHAPADGGGRARPRSPSSSTRWSTSPPTRTSASWCCPGRRTGRR